MLRDTGIDDPTDCEGSKKDAVLIVEQYRKAVEKALKWMLGDSYAERQSLGGQETVPQNGGII